MRKIAALALTALLAMPAAALAAKAPRVGIASTAQLKTPLPYPYDEKADADAQIAAAAARAKAGHKLLLIDFGGNWCGDCRILAGVMHLPEVQPFIDQHYEVVTVDVGRLDRNTQVLARYGVSDIEGVPALLIIDETGKVLNRRELINVTDQRHTRPQQMVDWLAKWTR
jgi:thiol:disulfide interchange protein